MCFAPLMLPCSVVALLFAAASIWRRRARELPLERGVCVACGYTLAGIRRGGYGETVCPECGDTSWGGVQIGRERVGWGWWAAVGTLMVGAVAALADAHQHSPIVDLVGLEAAMLLPSCTVCAGFVALVMAIVLTNHVKRHQRATLLIVLGLVQVASSLVWVWWEVRVMAAA